MRADSVVTHRDTSQQLSDNPRTYLVDHQNLTGYAQVLEESDGTALRASYTLADDVLGQTLGAAASWLLYDGHGSTRALADSVGEVTSTFSYDAYGVQLNDTPSTLDPGPSSLLYSGEQFDLDLQQQYLRARYYDQATGTFASLDPFAGSHNDPQSLHKYAYCHGDPVDGVDPSGEFTLLELLVVATVAIATASLALPVYLRARRRAEDRMADALRDAEWIRMAPFKHQVATALTSLYPGNAEAHAEALDIAEAYVESVILVRMSYILAYSGITVGFRANIAANLVGDVGAPVAFPGATRSLIAQGEITGQFLEGSRSKLFWPLFDVPGAKCCSWTEYLKEGFHRGTQDLKYYRLGDCLKYVPARFTIPLLEFGVGEKIHNYISVRRAPFVQGVGPVAAPALILDPWLTALPTVYPGTSPAHQPIASDQDF